MLKPDPPIYSIVAPAGRWPQLAAKAQGEKTDKAKLRGATNEFCGNSYPVFLRPAAIPFTVSRNMSSSSGASSGLSRSCRMTST